MPPIEEDERELLNQPEPQEPAEEREPDEPTEDVHEEPDGDVVVDLQASSRKERRRERGELFRALQRTQEEKAELEARLARLEGLAQGLQQQTTAQPQQQPAQQADPVDQLMSAYKARRDMILQAHEALTEAGKLTPEKQRELQDQLDRLETAKTKALLMLQRQNAQPQQADPDQIAARAIQAQLAAQYPDVYGSQRALEYASAVYSQLAAKYRGPDGQPTVHPAKLHALAMQQTRRDLGLQAQDDREPSPAERRRLEGRPAGHTSGAGGGKRGVVRLSSAEKAMADALYDHIADPKERYRKFARSVLSGK